MLTAAMFFFIGQALNAPTWYWVCWVISTINLVKVEVKWHE